MGAKPAGYRELSFSSMRDLAAELDLLERAHAQGRLGTVGGWTPGQNLQHVARFMRFAIDGFPFTGGLWAIPGRLIKPFVGKIKARPGFTLPSRFDALEPDENVPVEQGLGELREQMARLRGGERMEAKSPILGKLSHEQWTKLQLDHAAMHLGFLQPSGESGAETTPAGERAPVGS